MNLYYIGFVRIPTEKAHGLTIVKSCEAFARAGAHVTLLIPRRKTQFEKDIFETYTVERIFTVRYLPTLDLVRLSGSRTAFWISYTLFYISTLLYLLGTSKKNAVVYTRETPLLTLSWLGMPAFLESHHVFGRSMVYFWLAKRARGIITISHALKAKFVAAGFKEKNIIVQPSGVELPTFLIDTPQAEARRQLELPPDKKIITYAGNFTTMGQDKGISDILRALKHLPEVLFVAAGGSDKDREHYNREATKLGVGTQVCFDGFGPQTKLALYQRAADVLLMPFPDTPHYRSNMSPVKMFEYMASGRPIVASNLPTIREVLNENNSVIVPPDNPEVLAKAISSLLKDPERARQLSTRAQEEVKTFSWQERARRVLQFIG